MPLDIAYIEKRMKHHRVPGCSIVWLEHGQLMDRYGSDGERSTRDG